VKRDSLHWDYILAALGGSLTLYTAGMGLTNPQLGLFFAAIVVVGSAFSALVYRLIGGTTAAWLAGALYTAAAAFAFINPDMLNAYAPDGGFPSDTHLPALATMLALGSFFAWSESVLVFQAVPCIAVFGLVGSWETFGGTPFTFFGFLICMTALLSRVHSREMLRQARESGFVAINRIWSGPWRWVAGPQWALVSAAAIVLMTLVGAPVLQMSVSSVAGRFRVSLPAVVRRQQHVLSDTIGNEHGPSDQIGTGPIRPGDIVVLAAKLDRPRYLRDDTFDLYTGHGWSHASSYSPSPLPGDRVWQVGRVIHRVSMAQRLLKDPETIHFSVEVLNGIFETLPVPGEVTQMVVPQRYVDSEPVTTMSRGDPGSSVFEGDALVPGPDVQPRDAFLDLPHPFIDALTDPGRSSKVVMLARRAAAGLKTDFAKAMAIKATIENAAVYNLDAPAVPNNADAVEYFLFNSKQGYCDLFASAMVLMARAVGIPARYATGYYPFKDERDPEGRILLHTSERHAWAELFFKDAGWVPFDATEGAEEVDGYGRGSSGDARPWYQGPLGRDLLDLLIVAAAIGTLVLFVLPAVAGLRRLRQPGKVGGAEVRRRIGLLYAGLVGDVGRLTGIHKEPAQTAGEYLVATLPSLGSAGDSFARATNLLEICLYSPRDMALDDLSSFADEVKDARKAVRARIPPIWRSALRAAAAAPASAFVAIRTLSRLRREDRRAR